MNIQSREAIYCLSQVATEDDAVIQATSTEKIAKQYQLLHGGVFGSEKEVNLDDLFAESGHLVTDATRIVETEEGVKEAADVVGYAMEHQGSEHFSVEDATDYKNVVTVFGFDLESIKESIFEFYRKVKAFLINLWRKATRILDIMYRNVQSLKKEASQLNEKCRSIGYGGNVGGMFTAPSVAIISYLGKVDITSVNNGLMKTAKVYDEAIETATRAANAYYPKISEIVNVVSKQASDSDKVTAAFATVEQLSKNYDFESEPFTGGYVFKGYTDYNQKGFRGGFKIDRMNELYHAIDPAVAAPTVKEIQVMCVQVVKLCDKIAWGRARYRTIRTAHNTALDNLDNLVTKIQNGSITDVVRVDSIVSQLTRLMTDSITAPIQQLNTIVYRAAAAAMLYANRAVKHIEATV